ncbi:MAG: hypothetical protein F9K37_03800 [Bacteroidales bacterium]|nr:MAG: hypothetical protein F9K37_03800 [Bacteroidales bacterium]
MAYLTINPYMNDGSYDLEYLNKQPASYETEFLRCVTFSKPLAIKVDGKNNLGIILKAEE